MYRMDIGEAEFKKFDGLVNKNKLCRGPSIQNYSLKLVIPLRLSGYMNKFNEDNEGVRNKNRSS